MLSRKQEPLRELLSASNSARERASYRRFGGRRSVFRSCAPGGLQRVIDPNTLSATQSRRHHLGSASILGCARFRRRRTRTRLCKDRLRTDKSILYLLRLRGQIRARGEEIAQHTFPACCCIVRAGSQQPQYRQDALETRLGHRRRSKRRISFSIRQDIGAL